MLGSPVQPRAARLPARYLALSVWALVLAVLLLVMTRSMLGFAGPPSEWANLTVDAPAPKAHVFEVQVAPHGCSLEAVDGLPASPASASVSSISVYADDLYETYVALCRGRADQ